MAASPFRSKPFDVQLPEKELRAFVDAQHQAHGLLGIVDLAHDLHVVPHVAFVRQHLLDAVHALADFVEVGQIAGLELPGLQQSRRLEVRRAFDAHAAQIVGPAFVQRHLHGQPLHVRRFSPPSPW
jgi:hypothetical protein